MVVLDQGSLTGSPTMENVGPFVRIQAVGGVWKRFQDPKQGIRTDA